MLAVTTLFTGLGVTGCPMIQNAKGMLLGVALRTAKFAPKLAMGAAALSAAVAPAVLTRCSHDVKPEEDTTKLGDFTIGGRLIPIHVAPGVTLTDPQIKTLREELLKVNATIIARFNEITKIEITGISTNGGMDITSPAPGVISGTILPDITFGNLTNFLAAGTSKFTMIFDKKNNRLV